MTHAAAMQRYQRTTRASLQDMASTLTRVLGRVLTAYIVGVRNPKTISRWSTGEVQHVRDRSSEERLIAAYQIVDFLLEYEGEGTIRTFMMGMNPSLDDAAPADVLRNGNFDAVKKAANGLVYDVL